MTERTPCPIEACTRLTAPGKLLCAPCWSTVPRDLAREVYRTWRAVQHVGLFTPEGQDARRRYREARDAAIASVPVETT